MICCQVFFFFFLNRSNLYPALTAAASSKYQGTKQLKVRYGVPTYLYLLNSLISNHREETEV